jgi:hypothetical protein
MTTIQAWSCGVFFPAVALTVLAAFFVNPNDARMTVARALTYTFLAVTVLAFLVLFFSLALGY